MKKLIRNAKEKALEACVKTKTILMKNNGFGMNEILGIAAAVVIAALIIPKLRGLAGEMMGELENWWSKNSGDIFPTSTK